MKKVIIILTLVLLAFVVGIFFLNAHTKQVYAQMESELTETLKKARSIPELESAVGMPGVVLFLDNTEFWVAIAYTDSHTTGESCAIAKTSDGEWYKSHDHYCCGLYEYKWKRDEWKDMEDAPLLKGYWMYDVEHADSIASSKNILVEQGFEKIR